MHALRQQQTIAQPVAVSGFGYWSGLDVTICFRPAEPNTGLVFVRSDLPGLPRIPAVVANRFETPRRTTLRAGVATVEMVEHVLAACWGLGIDNCEIEADQAELPGCDGSSQAFVEALQTAGLAKQDAARARLIVHDATRVGDQESWVEAQPSDHGGISVEYRLDYGSATAVGRQSLTMDITPASFATELAAARTFLLQEEAEWLRGQGLGRRVSPRDVLVFDEQGPIDNELRFEDECVRHKVLDLVGDLALAGCDIVGHFVARRSGHRLNADLVRALLIENNVVEQRRKTA